MHRGYIALWRKFQDHHFWKEDRKFSKAEAWIDILWEAQHNKKPKQVILGKENMVCLMCNYGESLKSLRTWGKRWGWSKDRVQRFLKLLENMLQIETVNETVTTRIKVLNYKEYDPRNNKSKTEARQKRDRSETEARQDNNVNNDNNDKYPAWLDLKLWKEYKKYRVKIKKPMTDHAEKLSLTALKEQIDLGYDQTRVVNKTINSGKWTSFYPLSDSKNNNSSYNHPKCRNCETMASNIKKGKTCPFCGGIA